MQTLSELESGRLAGASHIRISQQLREFPRDLFGLAESLRILDLSQNHLSSLPVDFSRLKNLEIVFFSENSFENLPEVLSDCPKLEMVGFKSNQIRTVPAESLPDRLRWLILTDNAVGELPRSLGHRPRLQKLMLAGNRLRRLPTSLAGHRSLELLRIAANRLESLPEWLFELPRLAWLASSGNPCSWKNPPAPMAAIPWSALELGPLLGRGASGETHQASIQSDPVAVKIFKGATTSDGTPQDEMQTCLSAGEHPHLPKVLGELDDHPQGRHGLVLELLAPRTVALGNPPDFSSCTRDTFPPRTLFSPDSVTEIAGAVASACLHLSERGISHGDLYAHNILVTPGGKTYLTDFGAANRWNPDDPQERKRWEGLEARAFGCLLDDLLTRMEPGCQNDHPLARLRDACLVEIPGERPATSSWKTGLH